MSPRWPALASPRPPYLTTLHIDSSTPPPTVYTPEHRNVRLFKSPDLKIYILVNPEEIRVKARTCKPDTPVNPE